MSPIVRSLFSRARYALPLLLALGCFASSARAEMMIGVDLDSLVPVDSRAQPGGGFALRLGDQLHVPAVAFTPELAFSYAGFSQVYGPAIYRGTVGARFGVGEMVRPTIFGHVGFGRFELEDPGADPAGTAITYDAGLAIDFTLIPVVNLGVHATYNVLQGDAERERFRWVTLGAHVEFVF